MGLPAQEAGSDITGAAEEGAGEDDGLEAGELKIDTRELKHGHNDGWLDEKIVWEISGFRETWWESVCVCEHEH